MCIPIGGENRSTWCVAAHIVCQALAHPNVVEKSGMRLYSGPLSCAGPLGGHMVRDGRKFDCMFPWNHDIPLQHGGDFETVFSLKMR